MPTPPELHATCAPEAMTSEVFLPQWQQPLEAIGNTATRLVVSMVLLESDEPLSLRMLVGRCNEVQGAAPANIFTVDKKGFMRDYLKFMAEESGLVTTEKQGSTVHYGANQAGRAAVPLLGAVAAWQLDHTLSFARVANSRMKRTKALSAPTTDGLRIMQTVAGHPQSNLDSIAARLSGVPYPHVTRLVGSAVDRYALEKIRVNGAMVYDIVPLVREPTVELLCRIASLDTADYRIAATAAASTILSEPELVKQLLTTETLSPTQVPSWFERLVISRTDDPVARDRMLRRTRSLLQDGIIEPGTGDAFCFGAIAKINLRPLELRAVAHCYGLERLLCGSQSRPEDLVRGLGLQAGVTVVQHVNQQLLPRIRSLQ